MTEEQFDEISEMLLNCILKNRLKNLRKLMLVSTNLVTISKLK